MPTKRTLQARRGEGPKVYDAPLRTGFCCEVLATHPHYYGTFRVGSHEVISPRQALRWLRSRAVDVADQFDPAFAGPVLEWIDDEHARQHAMQELVGSGGYGFRIVDQDGTHFSFYARPVQLPDRVSLRSAG